MAVFIEYSAYSPGRCTYLTGHFDSDTVVGISQLEINLKVQVALRSHAKRTPAKHS